MGLNKKLVKTKFPAARIKRIMRLDEDVGKVSQMTPVLIAKALESFLQALTSASLVQTQEKQAKKVTVQHVKEAIEKDEKFDFLLDLVKGIASTANQDIEKPTKKKRKKKGKEEEEGEEEQEVVAE